MINENVYWFCGLPVIGKTFTIRRVLKDSSAVFLEADTFREQAWLQLSSRQRSSVLLDGNSLTFASARKNLIFNATETSHLYRLIGPVLVALLVEEIKKKAAICIVEIASYYESFIYPSTALYRYNLQSETHELRIAQKFSIDLRSAALLRGYFIAVELAMTGSLRSLSNLSSMATLEADLTRLIR